MGPDRRGDDSDGVEVAAAVVPAAEGLEEHAVVVPSAGVAEEHERQGLGQETVARGPGLLVRECEPLEGERL